MAFLSLLLLLGCLSPSISLAGAEAAGVLRQVVGGDDGGTFFEPFNVTYDHRALILGGKRRMLVSAGLHYPRATPEVSSEVLWCFAGSGATAVGRGSGEWAMVIEYRRRFNSSNSSVSDFDSRGGWVQLLLRLVGRFQLRIIPFYGVLIMSLVLVRRFQL